MSEHQSVNENASSGRSELMQVMDRPWVIIVLLLHVGLLGIPVYLKTKYSLGTRIWICIASIVYTVAAVAFIVLMLRWIAQMLDTLPG